MVDLGELPAQVDYIRMIGPEPGVEALKLGAQLVLLGAELDDRRGDRRQRPDTGPIARGVQPGFCRREVGAPLHETLGQVADLFGVQAGVHAWISPWLAR